MNRSLFCKSVLLKTLNALRRFMMSQVATSWRITSLEENRNYKTSTILITFMTQDFEID